VTPDIFFGNFRIGSDNIVVGYYSLFDFSTRLDIVAITNLCIEDVGLDSEGIEAADSHDIIFLRGGLKHNDRTLLDDVVFPKYNFEVFVLLLAYYRAGRVHDAPFSKYDIAYNFVEAKVDDVVAFIHLFICLKYSNNENN
jgi:hypothetical protein